MKSALILLLLTSLISCTTTSGPNLIKLAPVCDLKAAKMIKAGIAKCYDEVEAVKNEPVLQEKRFISDKARNFTELEKGALEQYAGEALEIALNTCVQTVMIKECGDVWEPVPFANTDKAKFMDCNMMPLLKKQGMATLGAVEACKAYEVRE